MSASAWITRDPISADSVLALVGGPADGAIDVFLGIVRDNNEGSAVSGMNYDAYVEMAEQVLRAIVEETVAHPGVGKVAAVHRIGELAVGDASVAIAAPIVQRIAVSDLGGADSASGIRPEWYCQFDFQSAPPSASSRTAAKNPLGAPKENMV